MGQVQNYTRKRFPPHKLHFCVPRIIKLRTLGEHIIKWEFIQRQMNNRLSYPYNGILVSKKINGQLITCNNTDVGSCPLHYPK